MSLVSIRTRAFRYVDTHLLDEIVVLIERKCVPVDDRVIVTLQLSKLEAIDVTQPFAVAELHHVIDRGLLVDDRHIPRAGMSSLAQIGVVIERLTIQLRDLQRAILHRQQMLQLGPHRDDAIFCDVSDRCVLDAPIEILIDQLAQSQGRASSPARQRCRNHEFLAFCENISARPRSTSETARHRQMPSCGRFSLRRPRCRAAAASQQKRAVDMLSPSQKPYEPQ